MTKIEFLIKKSRFSVVKSRFKVSKCADRGHSLNRDFTVLRTATEFETRCFTRRLKSARCKESLFRLVPPDNFTCLEVDFFVGPCSLHILTKDNCFLGLHNARQLSTRVKLEAGRIFPDSSLCPGLSEEEEEDFEGEPGIDSGIFLLFFLSFD